MNLNLQDKTALVWGSSQGIGKAMAKSFIDEGVTTCLCSRNEESLKLTAQEIKTNHWITADLSKPNQGKQSIFDAKDKLEKDIDILIINTGGPEKNNFLDVTIEQWQKDYQNLWLSSVEALQAVLPSMKKNNWGRIIFITSIAAKEPLSGLTTSNGLRAGISGLVKSISNEFSQFGITINTICPGYTNTDRLKALNLSGETVKNLVPTGRLGRPEEIGNLATFLASDLASYINAQSIAADGGSLKGHY